MATKVIQDQAATLRRTRMTVEQKVTRDSARAITRVISFTSGKGGVGKTNMVVNVAIALAREGKSVLLLDADLGLANVDVLLGVKPRGTLYDVFCGTRSLEEIIVEGPEGISIIPAASGVESVCHLTADQQLLLMQAVESVAHKYDYLLMN